MLDILKKRTIYQLKHPEIILSYGVYLDFFSETVGNPDYKDILRALTSASYRRAFHNINDNDSALNPTFDKVRMRLETLENSVSKPYEMDWETAKELIAWEFNFPPGVFEVNPATTAAAEEPENLHIA